MGRVVSAVRRILDGIRSIGRRREYTFTREPYDEWDSPVEAREYASLLQERWPPSPRQRTELARRLLRARVFTAHPVGDTPPVRYDFDIESMAPHPAAVSALVREIGQRATCGRDPLQAYIDDRTRELHRSIQAAWGSDESDDT